MSTAAERERLNRRKHRRKTAAARWGGLLLASAALHLGLGLWAPAVLWSALLLRNGRVRHALGSVPYATPAVVLVAAVVLLSVLSRVGQTGVGTAAGRVAFDLVPWSVLQTLGVVMALLWLGSLLVRGRKGGKR